MSEIQKFDNFWKNPEGKFSKWVNYALLIAGGLIFYKYLPEIMTFFDNVLHLAVTIIVIAAIGFCFWDNGIRTRLFIGYKALMTKFSKWWIMIDPIATLEVCLEQMRDNLNHVSKHITNLVGQRRNLKQNIEQKKKEIDETFRLASAAKEIGNDALAQSKARIAKVDEDSNKDFIVLHDKIEIMIRVLKKMEDSCKIIIDETEHKLNVQKEHYKVINAGHKALTGAMKFFSKSDEKEVFDETMRLLQEEMNFKLGEMERIMDMSKNVIESIDLKNMMYDKQGIAALEAWEKEADNMLLSPGKTKQPVTIELKQISNGSDSKYGSFFNK